MPAITMNRRRLLDLMFAQRGSGVQTFHGKGDTDPGSEAEMVVTWHDEDSAAGGTLPRLITLPRDRHREFLAWAYTYLAPIRPLTAYVRLLDAATAASILRPIVFQGLGHLADAFTALVIAETIGQLDARADLQQLTPSLCARSHSYALTRTLGLGFENQRDEVSSGWLSARRLVGLRKPDHDQTDVKTVFDVLSGCQNSTPAFSSHTSIGPIERACREIADLGDISETTWLDLIRPWQSLRDVRARMAESREERVRAFDLAWSNIADAASANPSLASFIFGYLGSRIAPGELEHFRLVAKTVTSAPGALLWFGACSGLRSNGEVLAFGRGLGRRILRDLEHVEQVLDRPRCDLSITELEVLLDREKPLTDFGTESNGSLVIELAPCVTTAVRWSRSEPAQIALFDRMEPPAPEMRYLVKDLSTALERVDEIRRRLERSVDLTTGVRDTKIYPKPKKKW